MATLCCIRRDAGQAVEEQGDVALRGMRPRHSPSHEEVTSEKNLPIESFIASFLR